ncbi:MAG: hypothetical protein H6706_04775 [Myxococcales bacterium]|nr:hypothetical protein [Myxococcales bacterium]
MPVLSLQKLTRVLLALPLVAQVGCYNTYNVTLEELSKAQEGGINSVVKMATAEGEEVVVTKNTKVGVTDTGGSYHAVSPFNFTLTSRQLVAPDEDLLLGLDEIQTGNVKLVSGSRTTLLVVGGVAALVGAGLFIALNAPERKEFGQ